MAMDFKMRMINFYPPYLGAGIKITKVEDGGRTFYVELRERFWNRNLVGTHFGGSLFAMCDPFFMLILMKFMRKDFIIWDKSAKIRFRKPGKGTVKARFHISEETMNNMREEVKALGKKDYNFVVDIIDKEGDVVATVEKLIYVKKK
jgi:acyl-coenzyme A thioesterase PaaI-like protein